MIDRAQVLKANQNFKDSILKITEEFIQTRKKFIQECPDLSIDPEQAGKTTTRFESFSEELIRQHTINQAASAITVYGANACGKTAFIQYFLQIGEILPSDVGPVTARIAKLTYSPGNQACVRVFRSLQDRLMKKDPIDSCSLSEFFTDESLPDHDGISNQLKKYLARPEDETDEKFAEWSRFFVEIALPSPILQLGIDVYDTPGFLSNGRDEILNQNLYELVKSIKPTLMFLYDNPGVSETDKNCFLSLKQAIGSLEDTPIFFLNTKADAFTILKNEGVNTKRPVSKERFIEVLAETRKKRYELLLAHDVIANEVFGGLPETIGDCGCFDICTVPQALTPFGEFADLINEGTFRRIIVFAVQSESKAYRTLADKIIVSIDEYFDLVLSASCRTEGQWKILREEALHWTNRFFDKVRETFPTIIDTIQENILMVFDKQKESIADRAGNRIRNENTSGLQLSPISNRVRDFVQIAVYEEVLKVAASESMKTSLAEIDQLSYDDLLNTKKRNELLAMAKRHMQFWEISGEDLNRKTLLATILEHLVRVPERFNRIVTSIRALPNLDWYQDHASQYHLLDALDNSARLTNEAKRREFARDYLVKMRKRLVDQKPLFERNISQWIEMKQTQFFSLIENGYQYAIIHMQQRRKAHRLTEHYSNLFAMFECQLIAAKCLLQFGGMKPKISDAHLLGAGGFFNVHRASWGDHENLAVKRQRHNTLNEYPYASFLEAHYHRAITNTRQTNVVPLSYLYFHNRQLSIFMPKYKQSLQKYLQENIRKIQFDQLCSFAWIIANVLHDIHQNDLVHRDIKSSNILLDDDNRCYLSDFGTGKEGASNVTVIGTLPLPPEIFANAINPHSLTIYDGKAVDIFAYGILLYELLPKREYHRPNQDFVADSERLFTNEKLFPIPSDLDDYKQLVKDCLEQNAANRPTAAMIIKRLEILIKLTEVKHCAICSIRERTVRTKPCGHKALCQPCRDELRSRNYHLCVICKKIMREDVHDDNNQTFIFPQQN